MVAKPLRRLAKQRRAQSTVEVILTAASQVLTSGGYGFSTTDRIAKRAGVSVGTVYQYFSGKDDIFTKLLDREAESLLARLRSFTIREDLSFASNLSRFLLRDGTGLHISPNLLREMARVPQTEVKLRSLNEGLVGAVRDFIRQYRPNLSPADLMRVAQVIVMAAEGVGQSSPHGEIDIEIIDELIVMIEAYLIKRCLAIDDQPAVSLSPTSPNSSRQNSALRGPA